MRGALTGRQGFKAVYGVVKLGNSIAVPPERQKSILL